MLIMSCVNITAREHISIVDNWHFYPATARSTDGALRVNLPYTWSHGDSHGSIAHYVRKVQIPDEWRDSRLFIKFHGVNNISNLFINGAFFSSLSLGENMLIADNIALIAIMGKPLFVWSVCLQTVCALSALGVTLEPFSITLL